MANVEYWFGIACLKPETVTFLGITHEKPKLFPQFMTYNVPPGHSIASVDHCRTSIAPYPRNVFQPYTVVRKYLAWYLSF